MKEKPVLEQFVSVQNASEALSCTPAFIYHMIGTGELKAIKMGSRAIRVSVASLNDLISGSWIDPDTYKGIVPEEEEAGPRTVRQVTKQVARSSWMSQK